MFQPTKNRKWVLGVLAALWLCFIWCNSLLDGADSSSVSGFVGDLLAVILGPWVQEAAFLIRKLGHFTEFFLLGFLLAWNGKLWKKSAAYALLGGLLAALTDETIQSFVPGRASMVTDVWIDFSGVLSGTVLLLWLHTRQREN
ncbi:MAG: VanZ family protein [Faecousia sp.]